MRITELAITALSSLLLLISCNNGENNIPKKPDQTRCFTGEMAVDQNDGTFYTQSDVQVDFEIMGDKLNFKMYKVKFANAMPIKLDMAVEGVDYVSTEAGYTISGDGIVPFAMGGPFEKFTITKLIGSITDTTMTISFICGEYPVTYAGSR